MDTATEQTPAEQVAGGSDARGSVLQMFRYSTWVHVGPDAENCDDREGGCGNPLHFHAWIRLPNQFQHQDIRERALAAKARRMRQLRDPDTDAFQILEAEMEELAGGDRQALIDELVNHEWWKTHLEVMGEVEEDEEFRHIDRDRERLAELTAMPADEQPEDELAELRKHFEKYAKKVEAAINKRQDPHRAALGDKSMDELVKLTRDQRAQADAGQAFMETYSLWQWLAGSYRHPPTANGKPAPHVFASADDLKEASPETVEALRAAFQDLETALQRGASGN